MMNRYSLSERLSGLRNGEPEQAPPKPGRARVEHPDPVGPPEAARHVPYQGTRPVTRADFGALKNRVQTRLITDLNPSIELRGPQVREVIEQLFNEILAFGPIEPLLHDDTITEIMVNGADQVWIERAGRLQETDVKFESDDHVRRIIDRIIAPLGRRCDEASPMVDARLPDGSRVNAIIPPLSLVGP